MVGLVGLSVIYIYIHTVVVAHSENMWRVYVESGQHKRKKIWKKNWNWRNSCDVPSLRSVEGCWHDPGRGLRVYVHRAGTNLNHIDRSDSPRFRQWVSAVLLIAFSRLTSVPGQVRNPFLHLSCLGTLHYISFLFFFNPVCFLLVTSITHLSSFLPLRVP